LATILSAIVSYRAPPSTRLVNVNDFLGAKLVCKPEHLLGRLPPRVRFHGHTRPYARSEAMRCHAIDGPVSCSDREALDAKTSGALSGGTDREGSSGGTTNCSDQIINAMLGDGSSRRGWGRSDWCPVKLTTVG
jgi:hypothetical protein